MEYIDLKEGNLEKILRNFRFNEEESSRISSDINYYDRYILVQEGSNIGFVSVLEQPFDDLYLTLTLDRCDLINYKGIVSLEAFLEVLDDIFRGPQITRSPISSLEKFFNHGFIQVEEKPEYKDSSKLIPVNFEILLGISEPKKVSNIKIMSPDDISDILNLFFQEYKARFRLVEKMYKTDPSSCFVYKEDGETKGVVFSERLDDRLYIHQLFVKKSERGKGIDRTLLEYTINYAKDSGYPLVSGNIRGNLSRYYYRFGVQVDESKEEEVYVVRFNMNNFR